MELIIELLWRGRELEMDDRHVVHMRTRCRSTGSTFCPEWWKHPEAVARFKALYIQYGHAIEDGEVSGWWIQHWDPHMRALCDPDVGPFRRCAFGHAEPKETVHLMVATPEVGDPDYEAAVSSPDPRWYLGDDEEPGSVSDVPV